jgi:Fic family protein
MDIDRFRQSSSGRVVRFGQGEAAYWAFLPNGLPPVLTFDAELVRVASDSAYALGELAAFGRTMANPHLLIGPFIRREAVLSSRIEGTQTDIADLYAYEAGQLPLPGMAPAPPASDAQEVLNYVHALEYGQQRLATLPVSLRLMRELHERLMRGVRGEHATPGEFRHSQNWIGRPGCMLNEATFVPPPPAEMHQALGDLEDYLHAQAADLPALVRLALIHYQFEAIHPFLDGNGRIGRLLVSLLLIDWGLLPLPLLYLSAYFESHREQYYDLLLAVSERGAWRDWVAFFLQGVAEQARDASLRVKHLQDLQIEWRRRLTGARTSALTLKLADSLFASPFVTIPQAKALLGVTYPGAQHNVEKLVRVGILRQIGESSYGKTYAADEVLSAILDQ